MENLPVLKKAPDNFGSVTSFEVRNLSQTIFFFFYEDVTEIFVQDFSDFGMRSERNSAKFSARYVRNTSDINAIFEETLQY